MRCSAARAAMRRASRGRRSRSPRVAPGASAGAHERGESPPRPPCGVPVSGRLQRGLRAVQVGIRPPVRRPPRTTPLAEPLTRLSAVCCRTRAACAAGTKRDRVRPSTARARL
jgi:hypothetical protein